MIKDSAFFNFATAHTLYASRDGSGKSGFFTAVPKKTKIFLRSL